MAPRRTTTKPKPKPEPEPEPEAGTYRARQAAAGLRAGELFAGDETHPVVRAGLAEAVGAEQDTPEREAPAGVADALETDTNEAGDDAGLPPSPTDS